MEIKPSKMISNIPEGIFTELNNKKSEIEAKGIKIYNLFVGTPDFPVFSEAVDALIESVKNPTDWHYSLHDLDELKDAVKYYYKERFNVELENDEIMAVPGSQEGLSHIGMALLDSDDIVLLPNPGYPAYEVTPLFAGAKKYYYNLKEENDYLINFDEIPSDIASKAKLMIVSYPYNPVCATAPTWFYEKLLAFVKKYNIILIHDNAYSDIIYDGLKGGSILEFEGAKDNTVEFFSLSKSFNLTGSRMAFVIGNKDIIKYYKLLRSQYDFGIFIPIQKAAIAALKAPKEKILLQCKEYEARRDALCDGLNRIGWNVKKGKGTMFMWAKIPSKYKTSREFVFDLVEKAHVFVTPGDAFGSMGEGYVRFALVLPVDEINKVIDEIDKSNILK